MNTTRAKLITRKGNHGYINPNTFDGHHYSYRVCMPNISIRKVDIFSSTVAFTQQLPSFVMSPFPSTSLSQSPLNTRSSSSLQFIRIRPAADAVKKLFRKFKAAPLIRRFKSEYIPYEEWKAIYMAEHPEEAVSSTAKGIRRSTTVFDYKFTDIGERTAANHLVRAERPTPDTTDTLETYEETANEDVRDAQISASDEFKQDITCTNVGNGLSDDLLTPDRAFVRAFTATSSNRESGTKVDLETLCHSASATVNGKETESDSHSTIGWSEYGFEKDYDLTYY